jgi:hypothetical protein
MTAVHFESYSGARTHLKDLLDAAAEGRSATIRRDDQRVAVVGAERLRGVLSRSVPTPVAVSENDGWSLYLPGLPVAADGATFDAAVSELIDALREYAEDWNQRLRLAANHQGNWSLVQLVDLSDADQIRAWITGEDAPQRHAG